MKLGLVAAGGIQQAQELARNIKEYLVIKGHKVLQDNFGGAEVFLVLGGDGTLIHTACEYVELGVPFVGINAGSLGFLTAGEGENWQEIVDRVIAGNYEVSERMMISAKLAGSHPWGVRSRGQAHPWGDEYRALNEIVIKGLYRVIILEITVGDEKFLTVTGDGVIVATQTGSTAYSLSAGGPIVDPEIDCLVVTPVNAVGLPVPSIVLSADDVLEIKLVAGDDVSLNIDGQEHIKLEEGQTIRVSRGSHRVKFAYLDRHQFLKALNAKFGLASRLIG